MSLPFFFFLLCLAMGLAAWTMFWWSVRSGQLKDPEAAAGEMMDYDGSEVAVAPQPSSVGVPVPGEVR